MSISARTRRKSRFTPNIWPGFVDALSTLLLVIIFLLSMFALAQFFMSQALSGRDEALARLQAEVSELSELLSLERDANAELRQGIAQLSDALQAGNLARSELEARLHQMDGAEERSQAAKAEVDLLNHQLTELRRQLASLETALKASEERDLEQQATIVNLSQRLNAALASKVEELAKYRSEFFGRLRDVLGTRDDIRIVGDRFVFQSEVLFESGSDAIGEPGRAQLAMLAATLKTVAAKIPDDIAWVLLVEGHTDIRPIRGDKFASNWELSTARALSVVHFLQAQGIAPERLAAAGFGPFQPLDKGQSDEAYQRNRRIELKFSQR